MAPLSHTRPPLVLASASPRRLQLLGQIGIEPDKLLPSEVDEAPLFKEQPRALARRLALSLPPRRPLRWM